MTCSSGKSRPIKGTGFKATVQTDWIKARSQWAELLLSVCTGALLWAKAGLFDGLEATTHLELQ